MNKEFFGITFAAWQHAPLVIMVCSVVVFLCVYHHMRMFKMVGTLAAPQWRFLLIKNFHPLKQWLKLGLLLIATMSMGVALLQPQWGVDDVNINQQGRDLYIALDVSRSMLAKDVGPDRLRFAKKKIQKIVQSLDADRVALVLFSGTAIMQCPLTTDYRAFNLFLDQVDAQTISSGSTALDQALKTIIRSVTQATDAKESLVVLLTDGEDFSSNLTGVRQQAAQHNVRVFALGVGSPQGAPVPVVDRYGRQVGHEKDGSGSVVMSRLNESMLHALATSCGGQYQRMTNDDTDVAWLIDRVHEFEKHDFADRQLNRLIDRYPWFAGISLVCLVLEWLL